MKRLIPVLLLAGSTMLAGCGDSNDYNEVTGLQGGGGGGNVGIEPQAVDDLYATDQNEAFTIAAAQGVLANDQLNTNNPATVTVAYPGTTAQGGTISGGLNDGSFTYSPAAGFVGTDTFSYTLNNGFGVASATVSIVVDAAQVQQGFVVDSATGNDATGNFDTGAPFATIQGAIAAAPIGADIQVRPGTYTGAVTLKDGQRLQGAAGGIRPVLNSTLTLANGNTVNFLEFRNINGRAIDANGSNNGTIRNVAINRTTGTAGANGTGTGIYLLNPSGTWDVSANTISDTAGFPVNFRVAGAAQLRATINGNTLSGGIGGIGFLIGDTTNVVAQIRDNQITSLGNTGVDANSGGASNFSLDLEDNTSNRPYLFFLSPTGTGTFSVEQLSSLTTAKPTGAGNVGTVDDGTGIGGRALTQIPNGSLGFQP